MKLSYVMYLRLPKTKQAYETTPTTKGGFPEWISRIANGIGPDFKIPEEHEAFNPHVYKTAKRLFLMIVAAQVPGRVSFVYSAKDGVINKQEQDRQSDIDFAISRVCQFEAEFNRKTKEKYAALDDAVLSWFQAGSPNVATWPVSS